MSLNHLCERLDGSVPGFADGRTAAFSWLYLSCALGAIGGFGGDVAL